MGTHCGGDADKTADPHRQAQGSPLPHFPHFAATQSSVEMTSVCSGLLRKYASHTGRNLKTAFFLVQEEAFR
jgi:hypothetical protein